MTTNRAADSAAQRAAEQARQAAERAQASADASRAWRRAKRVRLHPAEILLYSDEARIALRARLDDGYPHRQPAAGGWEDETRPGQVAATVFRGAGSAAQLPLRLVLGGWPIAPAGMPPCEQQIRALHQLGEQPVNARRGRRPPLVKVRGNVPHRGVVWFVDSIQWSEEPRATIVAGGNVVKTRVTVTLRQHVPPELVTVDEDRREKQPAWRRHRVRRGEDAWSIARDEIGTKGAGQARATIRQFRWASGQRRGQRVRDPKKIKAGDVLSIPGAPVEAGSARR